VHHTVYDQWRGDQSHIIGQVNIPIHFQAGYIFCVDVCCGTESLFAMCTTVGQSV
jgi:hypothetical protein